MPTTTHLQPSARTVPVPIPKLEASVAELDSLDPVWQTTTIVAPKLIVLSQTAPKTRLNAQAMQTQRNNWRMANQQAFNDQLACAGNPVARANWRVLPEK
ncbi:hypothetical protein [Herpetosiphon geysericola]|uniref:Uncharacterized protein n=1 Tax=Herpetosiphon geysericola TaxID=70996 RepID=A0A0P6YH54_9CHLR|nr:hypothetical protein [Herpetosiphon geysericola]KPL88811.1 hypothetical protein SE18_09010 [Herpetosiphon geysericola]